MIVFAHPRMSDPRSAYDSRAATVGQRFCQSLSNGLPRFTRRTMQPIEIFSEESVFVMYDYQTLSTMFMLQALGKGKTLLPPDELCKEGFVIGSNENQTPCAISRVRASIGAVV